MMSNKKVESIFRRKSATYVENPLLKEWILADSANPLNQIAKIIDKGEVLDVGCGSGILSRLLLNKSDVFVDGVDPAIDSEEKSVKDYRNFYSHAVEKLFDGYGFERYDWLVLADVIEHFDYPDEMLSDLSARVKPSAKLLISTPNVANISVRLSLMNGRFDYTDSGILESTHLRFITLDTLLKVLNASGLKVERVLLLNRSPDTKQLLEVGLIKACLMLFFTRNDETVYTFQFLAIASPGEQVDPVIFENVGSVNALHVFKSIFKDLLLKLKNKLLGRA